MALTPASPGFDVVAMGELVVDLVPGRDAEGRICFLPKPGGAPGNVAVGVARLGGRAAMLSKVGDDAFGRLMVETLAANGVATEGVLASREGNTSLAVVTVAPDGDRDFVLYRHGCADAFYTPGEVSVATIRSARILHVGSLLLAQPTSAAAQRHAVGVARDAGVLISADVNLRPSLWDDPGAMRAAALEASAGAHVLKVSEEELAFLAETSDLDEGIAWLWQPGRHLVAVTRGAAGAVLATARHRASASNFRVDVVDTVGCGDAFVASLLTDLAALPDAPGWTDAEHAGRLEWIVRRACAAGALAATAAGAMDALPTAERRDLFLAEQTATNQ